jgi:flagellar biosynthesis/type III secretory pathway M-ring protein FliF/YscJ
MAGLSFEEAKWVLLFGILIVILIWAMALTYLVLKRIREDEKKKEPKDQKTKIPDEKQVEEPESTGTVEAKPDE